MKLMLVDGNSVLNRAFYGVPPLTNSKGVYTNAVYGFLNIMLRHIEEDSPDLICVAFDLKAKTYRHLLYDGYKAGRKGMPDELLQQLPIVKKVLDAAGILRAECEGLEADDIIGIMSKDADALGNSVVIITGDKDELQLVNENITVKLAVTKQTGSADSVFTPEKIMEKYGLEPSQLIDLKALMGDSSDNIPGVPGVGEKTALKLLHEYKNLDGVYENIESQKGALKIKLTEGKESAYMSRELGRIRRELPDDMALPELVKPEMNKSELAALFADLEMNSMLDKFSLKEEMSFYTEKIDIVDFDEKLHSSVFENDILYLLNFPNEEYLLVKAEKSVLIVPYSELHRIDGKRIVTHDAKPLLRKMLGEGYKFEIEFDTILAAYVLNPSKSSYPLENIYIEVLGRAVSDISSQIFELDKLVDGLAEKMKETGSYDLYKNIELPLCTVLAESEYFGVEVDSEFLKTFGENLDKEIKVLIASIYDLAGSTFNINSPKQLGKVLFEDLLLPVQRKTKIGYSTDNEVLESLVKYHPIADYIIHYRQLTKLRSTYVDGLMKSIAFDGRIHTIFTQTVTQTGRISSIEPNLQNIPVRTALGRELRKAFVAKEGYSLIDADYSQIELRILAHIADDKVMQEIFESGNDIHTQTASEIFCLPEFMISSELRRRAKAINFGIVYGLGDYSLSQDIGVTRKEAKQYIENYLNTFSGVNSYVQDIIAFAREHGYIETLFGRRRYVPEITSSKKNIAAFAERVCRNTPIQGTAADIIKLAMVRVSDSLKREGLKARLILQIHDELIIEAPENEVEKASEILRREMEHVYKFKVPLVTDLRCGKTWFDTKD